MCQLLMGVGRAGRGDNAREAMNGVSQRDVIYLQERVSNLRLVKRCGGTNEPC